ncbi:hypothetical protein E4T56_gene3394 [Termitomyces sp. T112]|nr:hypothetical protein E4T56_gene3394 [Termitomyces sp. T112]
MTHLNEAPPSAVEKPSASSCLLLLEPPSSAHPAEVIPSPQATPCSPPPPHPTPASTLWPSMPYPVAPAPTPPPTLALQQCSPLANSDIFPAATNASPGSPEPWDHPPTAPDPVTCHQLSTLVPPTHSGASQQPQNSYVPS